MTMLFSQLPKPATGPMLAADRLNEILGLELAAQASYEKTAERWRESGRAMWVGLLHQLAEEHELAAESVREQISDLGTEPADDAGSLGIWAPVARAIDGDEWSVLGKARGAEQQMLERYQEMMSTLDSGSSQLLRNLLIPTQKRHVQLLTDLTNA